MNLEMFPTAPMLLALIIPIIYCIIWKKSSLKKVGIILICCVLSVVFYPMIVEFEKIFEPLIGYFLGKLILFTIIPFVIILYIEKWNIKKGIQKLGIRKEKIVMSILLGLVAVVITVVIALIIFEPGSTSPLWKIIMFFEAFNEEFLFRGVLLLYLWKITDLKIAYTTSTLAFILAHPQHFSLEHIAGVTAQAILLGIVTCKTKNIIGPWISHGLNRVIPSLIALFM